MLPGAPPPAILGNVRSVAAFFLVAAGLAAAPSVALAQQPLPAVVRARVSDAAQSPMPGVTLIVLRADGRASLEGTTNDAGRYTFRFVPDGASYRIVVRRIGYLQTMRVLRVHPGDTVDVALILARLPRQLDTVRVDARALSDDYYLDARMIAGIRHHYVKDAFDAIRDASPGMLGDADRGCRPAMNVWVNGVHVRFSPTASYDLPASQSVVSREEIQGYPGADVNAVPPQAHDRILGDVLSLIPSQDIAEIRYHNCWDASMGEHGTRNAIFITLNPGLVYVDGRGVLAVDSTAKR